MPKEQLTRITSQNGAMPNAADRSVPLTSGKLDQTRAAARMKKALPYLALLVGILSLTFSSLFIRWSQAPGPVVSFYRMAVAAVVLFPFFMFQPRVERQAGAKWILLPILAGVFSGLDHATWGFSLALTNVANATLLNNIAPLWVALVAFFLWKERLGRRFWGGLALALAGAVFVLGSDFLRHPGTGTGDLLAAGSSFFYAGYFLFTQRSRVHLNTLTHLWLMVVTAGLVLIPVNVMAGFSLWGYGLPAILSFLGAALISQVAGYLSLGYALGVLPASLVAPTMIIQPVLTAILAVPLAGEPLSWTQVVGGLTVLAGIYLVNTKRA
ncbi:MAG: DMT family transporter [Coprothermobacterota bacterium]|nr:DMT family transporter [Coprothermobacterota bacterium]